MTTPESEAGGGRVRATPVLQDGLFAGLAGAFTVAVVFFAYDWWMGEPLRTPSVLYSLVFEGSEAARDAHPEITHAVASTSSCGWRSALRHPTRSRSLTRTRRSGT